MFPSCFDWPAEHRLFNHRTVPAITTDNREQTLSLINLIGRESNRIIHNALTETPTATLQLAADMCIHAANLLEIDDQNMKALNYLALASTLAPQQNLQPSIAETFSGSPAA
ncbi:MAG: hypothetical protein K0U37_07895 [Gammaproteobacteria bacterium]|nr:hypothetical protein [Gammaproteobacteria bacterium]